MADYSRIRKISYAWSPKDEMIPFISLSGKWLEERGFHIGKKVKVSARQEQIVIRVIHDPCTPAPESKRRRLR